MDLRPQSATARSAQDQFRCRKTVDPLLTLRSAETRNGRESTIQSPARHWIVKSGGRVTFLDGNELNLTGDPSMVAESTSLRRADSVMSGGQSEDI
jgi:hypothetical protein